MCLNRCTSITGLTKSDYLWYFGPWFGIGVGQVSVQWIVIPFNVHHFRCTSITGLTRSISLQCLGPWFEIGVCQVSIQWVVIPFNVHFEMHKYYRFNEIRFLFVSWSLIQNWSLPIFFLVNYDPLQCAIYFMHKYNRFNEIRFFSVLGSLLLVRVWYVSL